MSRGSRAARPKRAENSLNTGGIRLQILLNFAQSGPTLRVAVETPTLTPTSSNLIWQCAGKLSAPDRIRTYASRAAAFPNSLDRRRTHELLNS
jgi:hypothetical protein